jgi:threonine dehydratase
MITSDLHWWRTGAIIASVGGGGLLCGIYEGLARHGWKDVTVVAAETEGAASFFEGFRAGKPVRLSQIATVATSLGALEVTPQAIEYAKGHPTQAEARAGHPHEGGATGVTLIPSAVLRRW